jgi:hypothetical protein
MGKRRVHHVCDISGDLLRGSLVQHPRKGQKATSALTLSTIALSLSRSETMESEMSAVQIFAAFLVGNSFAAVVVYMVMIDTNATLKEAWFLLLIFIPANMAPLAIMNISSHRYHVSDVSTTFTPPRQP